MRLAPVLALLALASGCDQRLTLVVDVRTDLVPETELGVLSAGLDDGTSESRVVLDGADDWLSGSRVGELLVDPGAHTVIVRAFDPEEREIVTRSVRVQVDVSTAVTVLLTRDCRGVICGAPGAEACWAGSCVSEECTDETSASCGMPECTDASDCAPASSCGTVLCEGGACLYDSMGGCGPSEFCDPEFGCRTIGDTGPSDGLIAHWRFDDDPSDGVLDSSGAERDGSCSLCPALRSGGPRGSYYLADASDQLITVPNDAVLGDLQDFTAAGWVRLDATMRAFRSFMGKPFGTGSGNSWELHIIDGTARFSSESIDTGHSIPAMSPMPMERWVHVAATFDGTTQVFYIDGVEQGSTAAMPLAYDDNPMALIADINGGSPASEIFGGVDDLRLYDRALSATEIADLATP